MDLIVFDETKTTRGGVKREWKRGVAWRGVAWRGGRVMDGPGGVRRATSVVSLIFARPICVCVSCVVVFEGNDMVRLTKLLVTAGVALACVASMQENHHAAAVSLAHRRAHGVLAPQRADDSPVRGDDGDLDNDAVVVPEKKKKSGSFSIAEIKKQLNAANAKKAKEASEDAELDGNAGETAVVVPEKKKKSGSFSVAEIKKQLASAAKQAQTSEELSAPTDAATGNEVPASVVETVPPKNVFGETGAGTSESEDADETPSHTATGAEENMETAPATPIDRVKITKKKLLSGLTDAEVLGHAEHFKKNRDTTAAALKDVRAKRERMENLLASLESHVTTMKTALGHTVEEKLKDTEARLQAQVAKQETLEQERERDEQAEKDAENARLEEAKHAIDRTKEEAAAKDKTVKVLAKQVEEVKERKDAEEKKLLEVTEAKDEETHEQQAEIERLREQMRKVALEKSQSLAKEEEAVEAVKEHEHELEVENARLQREAKKAKALELAANQKKAAEEADPDFPSLVPGEKDSRPKDDVPEDDDPFDLKKSRPAAAAVRSEEDSAATGGTDSTGGTGSTGGAGSTGAAEVPRRKKFRPDQEDDEDSF